MEDWKYRKNVEESGRKRKRMRENIKWKRSEKKKKGSEKIEGKDRTVLQE